MLDHFLGGLTEDVNVVVADKLMHLHVCAVHGSDRESLAGLGMIGDLAVRILPDNAEPHGVALCVGARDGEGRGGARVEGTEVGCGEAVLQEPQRAAVCRVNLRPCVIVDLQRAVVQRRARRLAAGIEVLGAAVQRRVCRLAAGIDVLDAAFQRRVCRCAAGIDVLDAAVHRRVLRRAADIDILGAARVQDRAVGDAARSNCAVVGDQSDVLDAALVHDGAVGYAAR